MATLAPAQLETIYEWAEVGGAWPQPIEIRHAVESDPAGTDAVYVAQGGAAIRVRLDGEIIGLVPDFRVRLAAECDARWGMH